MRRNMLKRQWICLIIAGVLILMGGSLSWAEDEPLQEPPEEGTAVQYTLTVEFLDVFGKELMEPHVEKFDEGDELTVTAPDIDGYELKGEEQQELIMDGDKTITFTYDEIPETGSGTINKDGVEIDPNDPSFLLKKDKKKSKKVTVTKKKSSSGSDSSGSSANADASSGYVAYDDSTGEETAAEESAESSEKKEKAVKPPAEEQPAIDQNDDNTINEPEVPLTETTQSHQWYWIIPILLIAAGILWWFFGKRRRQDDSE